MGYTAEKLTEIEFSRIIVKKNILFGLILFGVIKLTAQDFAPIGAEWFYTERHAFSGDITFLKITSNKDTIIDGKNCRVIQKHGNPMCSERPDIEYMYQEDSVLYFYDTTFNKFQILYDLTKKLDESWFIEVVDIMYDNNLDSIKITIDSISSIVINEKSLKKLHVSYNIMPGKHPYSYQSIIIENIGDINYLFNYYPSSSIACDGNYADGLRCYQDSEIGLYSTGIADSCDYTYKWTNIQIHETKPNIKISPNPTKGVIQISVTNGKDYIAELTDLSGKIIKTIRLDKSSYFDISGFQNGLYVLTIRDKYKIIDRRKIIKN